MLPGSELLREGRDAAAGIVPRQTAFCRAQGVAHEVEFKQRAKAAGRISYHAHIGLADWPATERALGAVVGELAEHGHAIDRYGLCLSRAMGLPPAARDGFPKETGPLLTTTSGRGSARRRRCSRTWATT